MLLMRVRSGREVLEGVHTVDPEALPDQGPEHLQRVDQDLHREDQEHLVLVLVRHQDRDLDQDPDLNLDQEVVLYDQGKSLSKPFFFPS